MEARGKASGKSIKRQSALFKPGHRLPTKFVKDCGFIPVVLINTASVVERFIKTKEIFQTQGKPSKALATLNHLSTGRIFRASRYMTVHDAVEALKLVLVSLPEPLIPEDVCDALITASRENSADQYEKILGQFRMKSPLNFGILHFMMILLRKVSRHTHHNMMDVRKLATIFVLDVIKPLKLDDPNDGQFLTERMQRLPYLIMVVEKLIHNVDIFKSVRSKKAATSSTNPDSKDTQVETLTPYRSRLGNRKPAINEGTGLDHFKPSVFSPSMSGAGLSTHTTHLINDPDTVVPLNTSSRLTALLASKRRCSLFNPALGEEHSSNVSQRVIPLENPVARNTILPANSNCRSTASPTTSPPQVTSHQQSLTGPVISHTLAASRTASPLDINLRCISSLPQGAAGYMPGIEGKLINSNSLLAITVSKNMTSDTVNESSPTKNQGLKRAVTPTVVERGRNFSSNKDTRKKPWPVRKVRPSSMPLSVDTRDAAIGRRGRTASLPDSLERRGTMPKKKRPPARGKVSSSKDAESRMQHVLSEKTSGTSGGSGGSGTDGGAARSTHIRQTLQARRKRRLSVVRKKSGERGAGSAGHVPSLGRSSDKLGFKPEEMMSPWLDEFGIVSDDTSIMTRTICNPRVLAVTPSSPPSPEQTMVEHTHRRQGRTCFTLKSPALTPQPSSSTCRSSHPCSRSIPQFESSRHEYLVRVIDSQSPYISKASSISCASLPSDSPAGSLTVCDYLPFEVTEQSMFAAGNTAVNTSAPIDSQRLRGNKEGRRYMEEQITGINRDEQRTVRSYKSQIVPVVDSLPGRAASHGQGREGTSPRDIAQAQTLQDSACCDGASSCWTSSGQPDAATMEQPSSSDNLSACDTYTARREQVVEAGPKISQSEHHHKRHYRNNELTPGASSTRAVDPRNEMLSPPSSNHLTQQRNMTSQQVPTSFRRLLQRQFRNVRLQHQPQLRRRHGGTRTVSGKICRSILLLTITLVLTLALFYIYQEGQAALAWPLY